MTIDLKALRELCKRRESRGPWEDAEAAAVAVNALPALLDLLDRPAPCSRCGRSDLTAAGYPDHIRSCHSHTDVEHLEAQVADALDLVAAKDAEIERLRRERDQDGSLARISDRLEDVKAGVVAQQAAEIERLRGLLREADVELEYAQGDYIRDEDRQRRIGAALKEGT